MCYVYICITFFLALVASTETSAWLARRRRKAALKKVNRYIPPILED